VAKSRRRLIVPEVVQTSAMDCGPASLKGLLEGFGLPVSYGRLREACQTDVDGTSIDTLEDIANQLGLDAEQVIVPLDHVVLDEAGVLPAIIVVRLPNGFTHFVVAWRTHAGVVQLMDPGSGRRWPTREQFLRDVYVHAAVVPAAAWREHAASNEFLEPLRARMRRVGIGAAMGPLIAQALEDSGWRSITALDASVRLVDTLARSGGLGRGREAIAMLRDLTRQLRQPGADAERIVPLAYWFARPAPGEDGREQILIRGAVLVRVLGRSRARATTEGQSATSEPQSGVKPPLSPDLVAALEEPPSRPLRELFRTLRVDGVLTPAAIGLGLVLAAVGTATEAVLFRGLFDVGRHLGVTDKRAWAVSALLLFLGALLLLELPLASALMRMGRRLEGRFRMTFLRKIPRLGDRYFQSRPVSDMADRSHGVHALRGMPALGGQLLRATFSVLFTTLGIAWLDPASAPLAVGIALVSIALPLALQKSLSERDLRVRSHVGALSRYYLDALLGLVPVRAHGAEPALRREHESLLVEWVHASRTRDNMAIGADALQSVLCFGLTGWLFLAYFRRVGEPGAALLLLYWAFTLPALGQGLALALRQIPAQRNVALRLIEPLGATEERVFEDAAQPSKVVSLAPPRRGVAIHLEGVAVRAGGHTILRDVNLDISTGSHVAIVGASGAGKSSLVGLLLGWHSAGAGTLLVDGEPLTTARLDALRTRTAWVDPQVQIWNRSLIDNLAYGAPDGAEKHIGEVIEHADLGHLLETIPEGLATPLGEGGGLVSGGEGQRVRLGRGALRPDADLVILDEPFRGLDRERRRELLGRARRWWKGATLLCITHDVGETRDFPRVLVVEGGRIVEDGAPGALAADPNSRYAAMLDAESEVRTRMWTSTAWRRFSLRAGVLHENIGDAPAKATKKDVGA
jgi:ABC-type bacteriocin/lantibiotic exporter with double-glycine peptidase domain